MNTSGKTQNDNLILYCYWEPEIPRANLGLPSYRLQNYIKEKYDSFRVKHLSHPKMIVSE